MTPAEFIAAVQQLRVPRFDENALPANLREPLQPLLDWVREMGQSLDAVQRMPAPEEPPPPERQGRLTIRGDGIEVHQTPDGVTLVAGIQGERPSMPIVPTLFPVKVTEDSGNLYDPGSASTNCSFTYTVTSLSGQVLGTAMTPQRPRYQNTEYAGPGAWSYGLGFWDGGTFILYEVVDEIALTDTCE